MDIARSDAGPLVQRFVDESILKPLENAACRADPDAVDSARVALAPILDALDVQLAGKAYIVGDYCYADVHWTA
ncbi:MAG: hypothetical protein WBG92_09110 [Thiohalocapsa sp.]